MPQSQVLTKQSIEAVNIQFNALSVLKNFEGVEKARTNDG